MQTFDTEQEALAAWEIENQHYLNHMQSQGFSLDNQAVVSKSADTQQDDLSAPLTQWGKPTLNQNGQWVLDSFILSP